VRSVKPELLALPNEIVSHRKILGKMIIRDFLSARKQRKCRLEEDLQNRLANEKIDSK